MVTRWTLAGLAAVFFAGGAGCSVLLDWNDFSGGDAGSDGSVSDALGSSEGIDESTDEDAGCTCVPATPSGWTGPVALYTAPAAQGAPPACGAGFAPSPLFDGNAGPDASPTTCSVCTCGAVTNESCTSPVITYYADETCATSLGTLVVTSTCQPVLGDGVTVSATTPTGGTCTPSGVVATAPPVVWSGVARACAPASTPTSASCTGGDVCMPTPPSPFSTNACVMQSGIATSCPAAYPNLQVFYAGDAGVSDTRGCSVCQCSPPSGAVCTIAAAAISACVTTTTLNVPNACTAFVTAEPVKLVANPTLADAGSCAVSGGGAPTGSAIPNGATSFCCSP